MAEKQVIQHEFHLGDEISIDSISYALRTIALRADMVVLEGADASKPTADGSKRFYYATDTDILYYDKGSWVKLDHTALTSIGTNTHAQIDTHLASTSNPHSVDASDVGLGNVTNDAQLKRAAGDFNTFTEESSPASDDIILIEDQSASYAKKKVQLSNILSDVPPLVVLQHTETAGTQGGGQSSGSYATRKLNTEAIDSDNICTLSSDEFTLPAGTYELRGTFPFWSCGYAQTRLYNVSDTSVECYGSKVFATSSTYHVYTHSLLLHRFTIASSKTYKIESRVSSSNTTNAWGCASDFGNTEIFGQLEIRKVA